MTQLTDLATPMMGSSASFHRHNATRQLAQKLQDLRASQLLTEQGTAATVGAMNLKHILRQIEPDGDNL